MVSNMVSITIPGIASNPLSKPLFSLERSPNSVSGALRQGPPQAGRESHPNRVQTPETGPPPNQEGIVSKSYPSPYPNPYPKPLSKPLFKPSFKPLSFLGKELKIGFRSSETGPPPHTRGIVSRSYPNPYPNPYRLPDCKYDMQMSI